MIPADGSGGAPARADMAHNLARASHDATARAACDGRAVAARVSAEVNDVSKASAEAVDRLVDEYRHRCLWLLRHDYDPTTDGERLRVLGYIQRHSDRRAYLRASEVRQWLSRTSSATSAAC